MRTLVSRAETFHGHPILRAILAVPAHFGDTHRTLLHEAARLANVTLLRIITEPTATAIGYGFADTASDEQRLLVLDVGASVSASVIENDSGALDFLARVTRARKSPFDDRIARYAEEMYVDMSGSREAVLREALHVRAEEAMFGLSTHEMAVIEVPTVDNTVFPVELTRHDFIRISVDIFEDVMQCVEEALVEANVTASEVDQIILAGGSAYIPRLSELLSQRFSDKIPLSSSNIRRDEAVVYGAGLHARVFEEAGDDFLCCVEITPLAFGIEEPGSIFAVVLPRNSVLPNSKTRRFNLTEREVRIFVGHGEYTTGNATHLIGHLVLPRTLTGEVQLRFDVDLAGVLTVVATNARGRSVSTTIHPTNKSCEATTRILAELEAVTNRDAEKARMQYANHDRLSAYLTDIEQFIATLPANHGDRPSADKLVDSIREADAWMSQNVYTVDAEALREKMISTEKLITVGFRQLGLGSAKDDQAKMEDEPERRIELRCLLISRGAVRREA